MKSRWTLNRAGILNVYQYGKYGKYGDETIELAGGRLLLRGVNGSGKSTAMNMLRCGLQRLVLPGAHVQGSVDGQVDPGHPPRFRNATEASIARQALLAHGSVPAQGLLERSRP
jgi:hypothetical protein